MIGSRGQGAVAHRAELLLSELWTAWLLVEGATVGEVLVRVGGSGHAVGDRRGGRICL